MHVCLTGPESSGKSRLATELAASLRRPLVLEQARELMVPGQRYDVSLLQTLSSAQATAESARTGPQVLDTDALVIAVWWRVRFAASDHEPWPPWLRQALTERSPRHYLLCAPDLPWEPDPLRESAGEREQLFERYEALLRQGPFSWSRVCGQGEARLQRALERLPAAIRMASPG